MILIILYLKFLCGISNLNFTEDCCQGYCFPRIIWMFWGQDNAPEDVLDMLKTSRHSLINLSLTILSERNVSDFLDLERFPKEYFGLGWPNKADYIRISLLEKYGGIWLDMSIMVTSGKEMEWSISQAIENHSEMVLFKYGFQDHDLHFSFLGAPRNSVVMEVFRKEYDKALRFGVERFTKLACKYLLEKKIYIYYRCGNDFLRKYFLIDSLFTIISFENSSINDRILRLPEIRGPNRLFLECRYSKECFVDRFLHDRSIETHAFIKIFGGFRTAIVKAMGKKTSKQLSDIRSKPKKKRSNREVVKKRNEKKYLVKRKSTI